MLECVSLNHVTVIELCSRREVVDILSRGRLVELSNPYKVVVDEVGSQPRPVEIILQRASKGPRRGWIDL